MDLRQLRYFVAVANEKNITRAANSVHAAQSTLSHQILKLEQELGQALFDRLPTGVALTEAGCLLKAAAERVLREIDAVTVLIRDARPGEGSILVLAADYSFCREVLPLTLNAFLDAAPRARLSTEQIISAQLVERMREAAFDIAIGDDPRQEAEFEFDPLYLEEMVLLAPAEHPLAGRRKIRLIELHRQQIALVAANYPGIYGFREWLTACGVIPDIVSAINRPADMPLFFERTRIPVIVARNAPMPEGGLMVPIEDPTPFRTIGVIRRRGHPAPPLANTYIDILRRILRGLDTFHVQVI